VDLTFFSFPFGFAVAFLDTCLEGTEVSTSISRPEGGPDEEAAEGRALDRYVSWLEDQHTARLVLKKAYSSFASSSAIQLDIRSDGSLDARLIVSMTLG
jgi:hypothetical protein